ncbi:MAG: branched-chain amino acid ABC transporter permease [Chloroflexi bacterium]|nr:MAG: branched-chain amino acid ABC transporter permease [Chloroflexota bacterium]
MDLSTVWDLFVTGILRGGLYALMAGGLALLFGVMNICNFAHGELFIIGSYMAYFAHVTFGLSPLLAILVATLGSFVAGILIEKTFFSTLRKTSKGEWVMNAFLVTLGLSVVFQNGAQLIWGVKYRGITQYWEGTIQLTPRMAIAADRAVAFLISIGAIVLFWLFMRRTQIGRAIRAVSQNERGAMLVGINLNNIHTLTFALGSMLAGLGGASLLSLIPAYPFAGVKPNIRSWFVVTVVGLGNVGGAIIGGFIVGLLESFAYYFLGQGWQDVASLVMLILLLLFKPSGLFGSEVKGVLER